MKKYFSLLTALAIMCTSGCTAAEVTYTSTEASTSGSSSVADSSTSAATSSTDATTVTAGTTISDITTDVPATTSPTTEATPYTEPVDTPVTSTTTGTASSTEITTEPAVIDTTVPATTIRNSTTPSEAPVDDFAGDVSEDVYDMPEKFVGELESVLAGDMGMFEPSYEIEPLPYPDIIIEPEIQPEAGLLTGGEWNDNDHWHDWISLYQTHEEWGEYRDLWQTHHTDNRIEVVITSNGAPVEGAKVTCSYMTAVTDNNGTAYLFYTENTSDGITVEYNGITEQICEEYSANSTIEYELNADTSNSKTLDLMLMVDTTGSMMDELSYLQEELKDVITRIKSDNGNIPIRISVNFYRDEGDDYVIREFEFTDDVNDATRIISEQSANGGGDTPEAVHTALNSALNSHTWNDSSTKLMFFVLDAPPHAEPQIIDQTNKLVKQAAEMGVRIIPVASSGVDKSTEYLLRTMAITTGGTYTFLTDDSGIGGGHIEPTIGEFEVEKLNDMMVRIANDYLK